MQCSAVQGAEKQCYGWGQSEDTGTGVPSLETLQPRVLYCKQLQFYSSLLLPWVNRGHGGGSGEGGIIGQHGKLFLSHLVKHLSQAPHV